MYFSNEQYAEKITALLRKAETTSPEEAEALLGKAQELIARYAIDEQMLAVAAGKGPSKAASIIRDQVLYHTSYSRATFHIGAAIARANNCHVLIRKGKDLMKTWLVIVGFEDDVRRVRLLDSAVQVQARRAMEDYWKNTGAAMYRSQSEREKFKARREFLFAFAGGLQHQLDEANRAGLADAIEDEASRADSTVEEATESVALVLASKAERVQAYMDEHYPQLKKARGTKFAGGDYFASQAGYDAGKRASTKVPGTAEGLTA